MLEGESLVSRRWLTMGNQNCRKQNFGWGGAGVGDLLYININDKNISKCEVNISILEGDVETAFSHRYYVM